MNLFFKKVIQNYRNKTKQNFLLGRSNFKHEYAIIGTGHHNILNIYPCLWYLGIPIKIICSANKKNAVFAAQRWANCVGTDAIEDILNDESIKGVFVITQSQLHAELASKLLNAGKHVFIEKPVGMCLADLEKVLTYKERNLLCQVGLQRRFSPIITKLKRVLKNPINYKYCFLIGLYPEGDVLYDVFIHPIDLAIYLFGAASIIESKKIEVKGTITYYLLIQHENVYGSIELSTGYSWESPKDELIINTHSEVFTAIYPYQLTSQSKSKTICNIPIEKVFKNSLSQKILLNSSFLPTIENNSLNAMGFYPELLHFVECVEDQKLTNKGTLESLLSTYAILETLKKL